MTAKPIARAQGFGIGKPLLCAAAVCVTVIRAAPVRADEASAFSDPVRQGIQLRRDKRDEEALKLFRVAYEKAPEPRTLAQIALAEQALGDWVSAEAHLRTALENAHDDWIEKHRPDLDSALESIRDRIALIELACNVPGALITVNGRRRGPHPAGPIPLNEGLASIEVKAPGYEPARVTVETRGRQVLHREIRLVGQGARRVAGSKHSIDRALPAETTQAATVSRDGELLGAAAVASGAVLIAAGVLAHAFREQRLSTYNNDKQCFYGSLSRDQRCGAYRDDAAVAGWAAVVGYGAGAAALGTGLWLLLSPNHEATTGSATASTMMGAVSASYSIRF